MVSVQWKTAYIGKLQQCSYHSENRRIIKMRFIIEFYCRLKMDFYDNHTKVDNKNFKVDFYSG